MIFTPSGNVRNSSAPCWPEMSYFFASVMMLDYQMRWLAVLFTG